MLLVHAGLFVHFCNLLQTVESLICMCDLFACIYIYIYTNLSLKSHPLPYFICSQTNFCLCLGSLLNDIVINKTVYGRLQCESSSLELHVLPVSAVHQFQFEVGSLLSTHGICGLQLSSSTIVPKL